MADIDAPLSWRMQQDGYLMQIDQLKAENAKLRELVRMAWKCALSGLSCSVCRLVAGGCTLQSAMRELGVDDV